VCTISHGPPLPDKANTERRALNRCFHDLLVHINQVLLSGSPKVK